MTNEPDRWRSRGARVATWLASGPVSVGLVLITWLCTLLAGGLRVLPDEVMTRFGAGPDQVAAHAWWTPLTSMFLGQSGIACLWITVLLLTVGVWGERRLGSRAYLAVGLACQVVGTGVGVLVADGLAEILTAWGRSLDNQLDVSATPFLVGALMAVSQKLPMLLRRRLRAGLGVFLLVLTLFVGHTQDLDRLFAALIGLVLGMIVWRREGDSRPMVGVRSGGRALVALIVAAVATATIMTVFAHGAIGPLAPIAGGLREIPYDAGQLTDICDDPALVHECRVGLYRLRTANVGSALVLLLPQILQIVLAYGLWRGRAAARKGLVVVNLLMVGLAVAHLVRVMGLREVVGDDATRLGLTASGAPGGGLIVPILVPALLLVMLVAARGLFPVHAPVGLYRRVWLATGAAVGAGMVCVVVLGAVEPEWFTPGGDWWLMITDYLVRAMPSAVLTLLTPVLIPLNPLADGIVSWVPILGWAVLLVSLVRAFDVQDDAETASDRARFVELLHSPGGTGIAWCGTWSGNQYWLPTTHPRAGIAWRRVGTVALTVGEPLCSPEELTEVVAEFADHCAARGLTAAFYTVGDRVNDIARDLGWTCVKIGEDTVLDLGSLEFKGKRFQDIRTARNHALKEGISARWTTWSQLSASERAQVHDISDQWVGEKGLPEMGFTLGGVNELADDETRLLIAVDESGTFHGVTSWMPVFRDGRPVGLTLDFMRRRRDGFRPVMEFLIASAAQDAQAEGLETLSLSVAPLAGGGDETTDPTITSILEWLGRTLEPVYGFRSLHAFKQKFQPRCEPVHLCLPDVADLPSVGLAVGRAYVPTMGVGQGLRLGGELFGSSRHQPTG